MKYRVQVLMKKATSQEKCWTDLRPSRSDKPYEWDTRREAEEMMRLCYGNIPWVARVVEVEA